MASVSRKPLLVAAGVLAAAGVTLLVLWPLHASRAGDSSLLTAAATRGDVVVTVGGVGKIVEARARGPLAVPATAAPATATAAPATGASPDSVFPSASGRIDRFIVAPGSHVARGQVIATLDDGHASADALAQARNDAATARLELKQKETSDPAKGLPPTEAELTAARAALLAARERERLVAHPLPGDASAARLDIRKAQAELAALTRGPEPQALAAARRSVIVATQKLALATGPAAPLDVATARAELAKAVSDLHALRARPADIAAARAELAKARSDVQALRATPAVIATAKAELAKARADLDAVQAQPLDIASARAEAAKAQSELDALRTTPPGPTQAALAAAELAVTVAQQKSAELPPGTTPSERSAAQLEVQKAQADLEALQQPAQAASASAVAAAQAALDLANQRLAQLTGPPNPSLLAAAQAAVDAANQKLAQVNRPPDRLALAAAQAAVGAATARLEQLTASPSAPALSAVQAAVAAARTKLALLTGKPNALAVASARLDLLKARADLGTLTRPAPPQALAAGRLAVVLANERLQQLRHPGPAVLDTARADTAKAAADLETLLNRGAPAGPLELAVARLKVSGADARVATAERQLGRLVVRAPFAGTVTALLTEPGAPVDPTTPVATVADLGHLAVGVDLSEFDVARVRSGQQALLSIDALGGKHLPGRVLFVAFAGVDSGGVVTFPVRVALTRAAGLRPGMNVSVRIVVASRRNVVRVPLEAVHDGAVTVVNEQGAQLQRRVRLGLADNKLVEVRSGVRAGEHVLLATPGG